MLLMLHEKYLICICAWSWSNDSWQGL